jgi:glycosyltransferase involved in cell wall biosynthesis
MKPRLIIIPSVSVWETDGCLKFDRKFYDGLLLYVKEWPGEICCVMRLSHGLLPDFGIVSKKYNDLPFKLTILSHKEKVGINHLVGASVVLASGDSFNNFHVSRVCKKNGIKCVYIIEYIPETRFQIISFSKINPFIKLRKWLFLWAGERKRLAAFKLADGLQANGAAACDYYGWHQNTLLYFDTRVHHNFFIQEKELKTRLKELANNHPLRLIFSGRLITMKGADHLIALAGLLRSRHVNFKMTIYGAGELENDMVSQVAAEHLSDRVNLVGAVDFYGELLPSIKSSADVYVILHRQSDPSCTYMETLSCGIPIVGYENKAFGGLLRRADVGWACEVDDLGGVADVIERIDQDRELIVKKSINSANFSQSHSFEATFEKRVKHLYQLLN